jgi:hypothetical protein
METTMTRFLPVLSGALLLASSNLVVAADGIPRFEVEPSCHAAAQAATSLNRSTDNCIQDERNARGKVEQEWSGFTAAQQGHCTRLSQLGGMPSYVELLTCLEMAKQADAIPDDLGKRPMNSTTGTGG